MMKKIMENWRGYKNLLTEQMDREACEKQQISYGWISPEGEIFKCSDYPSPEKNRGHLFSAVEIIDKFFPEELPEEFQMSEYEPYEDNMTREEWEEEYGDGPIPKNVFFKGEHTKQARRYEAGRSQEDLGNEFMFHEIDEDNEREIMDLMFRKGFVRMANVFNYQSGDLKNIINKQQWKKISNVMLQFIKNCPNVKNGEFYFSILDEYGYPIDTGLNKNSSSESGATLEEFLNWMGKYIR